MTLSTGYELATDAQFRELGNFSTPPRAGRITAIEGNGQVRVATDDPDGGDVLAWPLNGFTYAVNDVIYIAFAVNNPESAIVIGSKGTLPALDASVLPEAYVPVDGSDPLTADWDIGEDRRIKTEAMRARDAEGLRLEDDEGNLGLFVADGGHAAVGTTTPGVNIVGTTDFNAPSYTIFQVDGAQPRQIVRGSSNAAFDFIHSGGPTDGKWFVLQNDNGTVRFLAVNDAASSNIGIMFFDLLTGNVGYGTSSPQGKLHAMGSVGRLLFVEKSGIVGSAQTIIPNGAGDVTRALFGWFVLSDGTSGMGDSFTLSPGANLDISLGGSTWRLALNANGALTVVRQSGSGTASLALLMLWI